MVDIDQSDQSPLAVPLLARSSGKKLGSNRCRSIRIARASFLRLGAFFFPSPRMALKASVSFVPLPSSSSSPYRAAPSRRVLLVTRMLRNSFLNGGVGSLKAREINSSRIKQLKCHPYGGGSLVVQMNLFDRLARVVKSYANAILSSMEDPEKILDQAVLEMNDDLTKMRQATAQVLASQKRLENKYKATQQASDEWYRKAQLALGKGDEDLAREALKRRKSYADNASSLKAQLDQQRAVVDNLVSNTKLLESKIQEARSKKDTLKARAQSAKTATKVSEMLGNVDTSSALSAFEKMEEKVLAMESQAEALNQLTTDDLEGKFALLESSSVEDDLATLKKELSGRSPKGELPAGRTAVSSSNISSPFRDMDIERELNELRKKANEY
ncbi:probable membrane-associated 30 kDa protein, chloroplastic isoform X1 [Zingiber officinale]|uniref:probable membrane-associated 30 kDa protein, chloroplastic isoform X1 n=2 Tax=Zingiber officinale TaxID=94328 RepID=UPI001C4B73C1|nr:probable membrane-associated 30 kDa protein, chloroplastic isoform X1 [Zingiber officinale]